MDVNDGVVVTFISLVVCIVILATTSTLDPVIIKACKEQGYWQTGQTRVICSVEEPKK